FHLSNMVRTAVGVTHGSSCLIPRLLLPQVLEGKQITGFDNPQLAGSEIIEGTDCNLITGERTFRITKSRIQYTIWIDSKTYPSHKVIEQDFNLGENSCRFHTIIEYKPQSNAAISLDRFEFDPPRPELET